MKKFRILIVALVALLGLNSCEQAAVGDNTHAADLVGTWTCLTADFAEALVISADGTVVSTGVANGEYWENVAGTIKAENSHVELTFADGDNFEGHFDIIPGAAFSITNLAGEQLTYKYCTEDLSEEIIGMWVSTQEQNVNPEDVLIQTFKDDGKSIYTGFGEIDGDFVLNKETPYSVIGDLCFQEINGSYIAWRLTYSQNGTSLGDILSFTDRGYTSTWLRINQGLDVTGKEYDYSNLYVSNVKGLDKEIAFMGYTMNFAKMDGSQLDMMLKTLLFNIKFDGALTLKYTYALGGSTEEFSVPISIEGNKLTVRMSEQGSALHDVELYAFQDSDACQMHIYMHRNAVVDFYTNMQAFLLSWQNDRDVKNDADAVEEIYKSIDEAIETINLSIIMKAAK